MGHRTGCQSDGRIYLLLVESSWFCIRGRKPKDAESVFWCYPRRLNPTPQVHLGPWSRGGKGQSPFLLDREERRKRGSAPCLCTRPRLQSGGGTRPAHTGCLSRHDTLSWVGDLSLRTEHQACVFGSPFFVLCPRPLCSGPHRHLNPDMSNARTLLSGEGGDALGLLRILCSLFRCGYHNLVYTKPREVGEQETLLSPRESCDGDFGQRTHIAFPPSHPQL